MAGDFKLYNKAGHLHGRMITLLIFELQVYLINSSKSSIDVRLSYRAGFPIFSISQTQ